jgi:hypothetical protein
MHVAIASIKEIYNTGRRQHKDLEGWEAECLKFLRQLMRHPWVSAERPKYIFHVPVHYVFPEIKDEYAKKIKKPMDLTTAEAKLLQGAYQDAEEFISDIALVFSNAIAFNKEGHDVGEPMSCAYHAFVETFHPEQRFCAERDGINSFRRIVGYDGAW